MAPECCIDTLGLFYVSVKVAMDMIAKVSADKFVSEMCRKSYYQFFLEFWSVISEEKLVASWYIKLLCDELQEVSERVFANQEKDHDILWNCPPGTSKSSCVSVLWQPWIWTRMANARFISGSHSERLALDLARKSRDVVTSEKYQRLFPEIQLREDQNAKSHFVNTRGGMRYAVGVGGSVTGQHAHFIAVDDPIDPQGALSDIILAEANHWMNEVISRRKVSLVLTPMITIMQRLHQDDPSGNQLTKKKKIRLFCVPCDTSWDIKPEYLKQYYSNGLLDPIRLPQAALDEAHDDLLDVGYACQYGQRPIPRGGAMFNCDKFSIGTVAPRKWKKKPIRYWDKATIAGGGAFSVGVLGAMDMFGYFWILDVKRGQWNSGERERIILETADMDGSDVTIWQEQEPAGSGKEVAEDAVARYTLEGYRAHADKVTGSKELRAELLSQYVNSGKVFLLEASWNKNFLNEFQFFPRSKYKDQVDATSGCFSRMVRKKQRIGSILKSH